MQEKNNKKIIELCLSPDLGGLELSVFRNASELDKKYEVLGVINPKGRLRGYFENAKLEYQMLTPGFKSLPILNAIKLAKIIDSLDVMAVHVHWGKDLPLASMAKALSKSKPRLVSTRHMSITRYKTDLYHDFIYNQIDLILTITRKMESDVKRFISRKYSNKVKTLYHGVSSPPIVVEQDYRRKLRSELGIPNDAFLVGIFGRIKHEKGQYLLIDAIKKLHKEKNDVYGLIVGNPMEKAYLHDLKSEISKDKLDDLIYFKDFVDDPQLWMQICDVVVLASHGETFGLVLVEAMQAGIAVIGTNDGGVPEIIEHEKTGLLFQPGDSQGLAENILRLVEEPELRDKIARSGKAKADELFDYSSHFEKLGQYLEHN
ncbi:glycosyltransferase family 4 protein [Thiohalophilus sp.]|uniref:glycosyltransferase family 4 protein n=1 Tax=Thiohalophilus sp. TaxID=3028392 RepID=UPI003976CDB7